MAAAKAGISAAAAKRLILKGFADASQRAETDLKPRLKNRHRI
jgi:hypothetical protein